MRFAQSSAMDGLGAVFGKGSHAKVITSSKLTNNLPGNVSDVVGSYFHVGPGVGLNESHFILC